MGCTCPSPGDEVRGEFVLEKESQGWSYNNNALSLSSFFLTAREENISSWSCWTLRAVKHVPGVLCGSQFGHKIFN